MNKLSEVSRSAGISYPRLIAYLVGLSAFGSFVNDMYMPSLPSMVRFFHCSVPVCEMGVAFGMAGLGIGEIIMGPVSDRYGRKPVLYGSLILFIIAAVVSIFSPDIHFFIGCRFFQGCGAAGGYFLARTIPTDIYGGRMLAKVMAVVGAINGFAPASAPVVGGFISQKFGWQGVFIVLTIFAAILFFCAFKLKETHPRSASTGTLLSSFGDYGRLLRNSRFVIHMMLKGTALGLLFAYISSAPFIMQTHYGFSQINFGLIVGGNSLMAALGAILALKFKKLKKAALFGASLLLIATIAESAYLLFGSHFLPYELLLLPILFALSMLFTSGNTLAMNDGRKYAGGASALVGLAGYLFGCIASPIVGLGDVLHPTAFTFLFLALLVFIFAVISNRLPDDPALATPAPQSATK